MLSTSYATGRQRVRTESATGVGTEHCKGLSGRAITPTGMSCSDGLLRGWFSLPEQLAECENGFLSHRYCALPMILTTYSSIRTTMRACAADRAPAASSWSSSAKSFW